MADLIHAGVSGGAVEEAAPPAPVESEIGALVAKLAAGEMVEVQERGTQYQLQRAFQRPDRLIVWADGFPVNSDEWYAGGLLEQEARAMLAAIFAGIDLDEFECGQQINSAEGLGFTDS